MRLLPLLAAILLTACSTTTGHRAPASSKDFPWGLASSEVPDVGAILRWSDPRYEDGKVASLDDLEPVEVPASCNDRHLYPTHPQQNSKTYHVYRMGIYENTALAADSQACKLTSRGEKKFCLLADVYEYAVISDVFQDACGNLYRGLWQVGFLKRDDNMGMLLSRGRTVYPKENAEYQGDMEVGPTYALDRKDFLMLVAPFAGDQETAGKLASEAQATHSFDPATHLFQKKGLLKAERRAASAPIALEPKLAE